MSVGSGSGSLPNAVQGGDGGDAAVFARLAQQPPDGMGNAATPAGAVNGLYQQVLGRDADPGGTERNDLFLEPTEERRVARLEPDNARAGRGIIDEQLGNMRRARGGAPGALADRDELGAGADMAEVAAPEDLGGHGLRFPVKGMQPPQRLGQC